MTEKRSFWMSSLWAFSLKCVVELLSERAQIWPLNYVQVCWPERRFTEKIAMLQGSKKDLRSMIIRENALVTQLRLANIRSN